MRGNYIFLSRAKLIGNESCFDNTWGKLLTPHAEALIHILSHTQARANSHYTVEEYMNAVQPALRYINKT